MSFSLVVLLPNGRRQNVKVDHNTTILEVIENVCQKAGLTSEEYDLKHHRHILTTSSTIRFASLPQNALVELVEAKTKRVVSNVKLCLQLESGERVQNEIHPDTTLWEFIEKSAMQALSTIKNPVVIYMRRKVIGKEALEKTTLRAIGLTGGSAMLRLVDSTEEALLTQANISTPLVRPQPVEAPKTEMVTKPPKIEESSSETVVAPNKNEDSTLASVLAPTENKEPAPLEKIEKPETPPINTIEAKKEEIAAEPMEVENSAPEEPTETKPDFIPAVKELEKLGKRNAVAYNMHSVPPVVKDDLPDDFYDLTTAEIQRLAAASSRALKEIIDAPLLTSAQRKLDENGLILQKLSNYKSSVVRIRFPDHTVLQGCFKPIETIGNVKEFVIDYLQDKNLEFYLYITPPKCILKENQRLVESNCVPNAVLYFGVSNKLNQPEHYLQNNVLDKFSSFSAVSQAAYQQQKEIIPTAVPVKKAEPEPSTSQQPAKVARTGNSSSKVPKWFKTGK